MALKEKHQIENYEEKSKLLCENGWETWYHDDNWIKTEWIVQGKKYDMMGRSTDSIYSKLIEKVKKEITEEPKLNKILKNLQDSNYLPAMDDDTRDTLISLIKETPKQITMTPKEIATQICDAFYQKLPLERYVTTTDGDLSWEYNSWQRAKECALIAVDEIISSHNKWDDYAQTNSEEYYYWQEIKQEIENL